MKPQLLRVVVSRKSRAVAAEAAGFLLYRMAGAIHASGIHP
jgi:hypothetical protein